MLGGAAAIIIRLPRSRDTPRRLSAPLRDYSARRLLLLASRHESAFFNLRRQQPAVVPGICVTNRSCRLVSFIINEVARLMHV